MMGTEAEAEIVGDTHAAAFNLGYDHCPLDRNPYDSSTREFREYVRGFETAIYHNTPHCCQCDNPPAEGTSLNPEGFCSRCLQVMSDYGAFDYMDEEDDPDEPEYGICQICGGEWGDGYTTCTCNEPDINWYY